MARFALSIRKNTFVVAVCVLAYAWTPVAVAQHGGHVGGVGHLSGGARMIAPHGFAPRASTHNSRFRSRPIYVLRPPMLFGPGFSRFRFGLGFNSFWWPCSPFWGWVFSCNPLPFYEYGFLNYESGYNPDGQTFLRIYQNPEYENPSYLYDGEGRELPQLYLKDGTVFSVTDYWVVNGQMHFTEVEESGTKTIEQVIDFEELDLQKTIDENTQRGFHFMLRNEPAEQYLRDHPDVGSPVAPPRQEK
jgi:hypothetical protein